MTIAASSPLAEATIHVGLTKCASTTLQDIAHRAPGIDLIGYQPLDPLRLAAMQSALQPQTPAPRFQLKLPAPALAPGANPLLSDERLVDWRTQQNHPVNGTQLAAYQRHCAQSLKQLCPRGKVLLITRRPDRWIQSRYRQDTLLFNPLPLLRYARRQSGYLRQAYGLDFLYDLYADLFGAERVCVLPMELLQHDPAEFYDSLQAFTGLSFRAPDTAATHQNRGLSDAVIEQIRRFHATVDAMSRRGGGQPQQHWTVKRSMFGLITQTLLDQPRLQDQAQRLMPDFTAPRPPADLIASLRQASARVVQMPAFDRFRDQYLPQPEEAEPAAAA